MPETTLDATEARRNTRTVWAVTVAAVLFLGLGALAVKAMVGKPTPPARQVARISVLPDTPPPPPPPKPDKPPEPKEAAKPAPREEQPRPVETPKPADAPLKMEGPTGSGPSAFEGGAVTQDYQGGTVSGGGVGGATGTQSDRALERFYASTARQTLRDELDRRLQGESSAQDAVFSLWIAPDGAIRRYELAPSGNDKFDGELRAALDDAVRAVRLPPPPAIVQPMRFRLSLRATG